MTGSLVALMIWVALGGGLGSMARAALSLVLTPRVAGHWVILGVNLSGSLAIGLMLGALTGAGDMTLALAHPAWVFGAIGVLGGFTTVSTFALQTDALWHRAQRRVAALYLVLSALGGPVAAALGWAVASGLVE